MPSSVWPCSHPTRSSAKVLPVQLEEDAALILERHPMLLHFAKNGLEFRTCVHKSVSTFSTAVSGSKYKLKQAAVSLKSSKLAADLRHIWLLEGRVHPTIRVQVVECRCWCRFSSFAHNRRTLQRRPYLHTRNYVYSSCIRTRGIERRATSLKKDETVCHGLDTQSASYRDPRQIWRSPLTGVVSPWRKINGRRTTQISSWRWSTTTQQQVSAPSSEFPSPSWANVWVNQNASSFLNGSSSAPIEQRVGTAANSGYQCSHDSGRVTPLAQSAETSIVKWLIDLRRDKVSLPSAIHKNRAFEEAENSPWHLFSQHSSGRATTRSATAFSSLGRRTLDRRPQMTHYSK